MVRCPECDASFNPRDLHVEAEHRGGFVKHRTFSCPRCGTLLDAA